MDDDGRFIALMRTHHFRIHSESGSESVICDSDKDEAVEIFLLVDAVDVAANASCACASICCFGKSWDGHSK